MRAEPVVTLADTIMGSELSRRAGALFVALFGFCTTLWADTPAAVSVSATPAPSTVVGRVGSEPITSAQVTAEDPAAFQRLQTQRAQQLHEVELLYEETYHQLLEKQLGALLDRRALELEAKARGTTTDAVLAEIKPAPVTDQEMRAFYEARRDRTDQPYEKLADQIRQFLSQAHQELAMRQFYDSLRARRDVRSSFDPYRMNVNASGPARGPATASVTIVEFGDFQCPYCRKEEPVLRALLSRHPKDVRLVFRNLPLADLHPNANIAAQAGVCADQQGKFWVMHDAMYEDQTTLSAAQLEDTAARLGFDRERFATCLDHADLTRATLDSDAAAAADLGLASTPFFFVNGRPLRGTVSAEDFERILAEELSRRKDGS
jgi:protein-disulfide isomerase